MMVSRTLLSRKGAGACTPAALATGPDDPALNCLLAATIGSVGAEAEPINNRLPSDTLASVYDYPSFHQGV